MKQLWPVKTEGSNTLTFNTEIKTRDLRVASKFSLHYATASKDDVLPPTESLRFYYAGWGEGLTLVSLALTPVLWDAFPFLKCFWCLEIEFYRSIYLNMWKYAFKSDDIESFGRQMNVFSLSILK